MLDNEPRRGPVVVVHTLDQAMAATAAAALQGWPLTLLSAAGGGLGVGVGWFAALSDIVRERHPQLDVLIFIDCGDAAGTAAGALRRRLNVIFSGHEAAFSRLDAIAAQSGLTVLCTMTPDLDLLDAPDAGTACRDWFARHNGP